MRIGLSIAALFMFCSWCLGQATPFVSHIGYDQGFNHATVYCFVQDRKGFIWYGTSDGLWRYDGYEHIVYRHDPKNSSSLGNSFVRSLFEDDQGFLWVGTLEGLNRFDPATQKAVRFRAIEGDSTSLLSNDISEISQDEQGRIWIAANKLSLLNPDGKTFTHFDDPDITQWGALCLLADVERQLIWIGSPGDGFSAFDPQTKKFKNYRLSHPDPTLQNRANVVRSIKKDKNGLLWMATYGGLIKFDPVSEKIQHWFHEPDKKNSLPHNSIWEVVPDHKGKIWIASWGGGISYLDVSTGKFHVSSFLQGGLFALPAREFPSLFIDNRGLLWCGSNGKGIFQIPQMPGLEWITSSEEIPRPIDRVISGKEHTYFLPQTGGVVAHHRERGIDYHLPPASAQHRNSLSGNRVSSISVTKQGVVAIGTDFGLTVYSPASKKIQHFVNRPGDTTSLRHNAITTTCIDYDGKLWVGTPFGICLFNPASGTFKSWRSPLLSSNTVLSIARDSRGLWVGTAGGLNQIDIERQKVTVFQHNPDDGRSLGSNFVSAMLIDSYGTLWVGTRAGISKLNADGKTFSNVSFKAEVVTQLSQKDNMLLARTDKGFYQFSLDANNLVKESIPALPIGPTPWSANEKTFFLVSDRELAALPLNLQKDTVAPPCAITRFSLNTNTKYPLDSATLAIDHAHRKSVTLNHHQNVFFVEFAALNYQFLHKSQYAYKLEGFDADWTYSGTRRFVSYTNLDPGTYTFLVKAANQDGVWNNTPTTLQIVMRPPPWRTSWAYAGYGLLLIAIFYAARKIVVNRERLKAQVLLEQKEKQTWKELDRLKTNFFANITHEFRTPLTLIQGPTEQLLDKAKTDEEIKMLTIIRSNSKRLLNLINQLLDLARLDARETKVTNKPVALYPFFRAICAQFESLAADRGITYGWHVPEIAPTALIDAEKVEAILVNLISNAIKFTAAGGRVDVQVTFADQIFIAVQDSGRGIPKEKLAHVFERFYQAEAADGQYSEGTGIGLALVKEYVVLMKGRVDVESVPGEGSHFAITLPLLETLEPAENLAVSLATPDTVTSLMPGNRGDLPLLLLADDNDDMRTLMVAALGSAYRYALAKNGREALDLARKQIPDLIISDIMMPVMDGIALCDHIKTDPLTDHIPLIMLTAKSADESRLTGLRMGADDYLTKPFNKTELVLRVQNRLSLQQKLRDYMQREVLTAPDTPNVKSANEVFVWKAKTFIEENLKEEKLSVELLADHLNLSREQCYRKLTSLTGLSPSALIRKIRLLKAQHLLQNKWGNISQVAFEVGFESLSHFTKAYKEQFGYRPSET